MSLNSVSCSRGVGLRCPIAPTSKLARVALMETTKMSRWKKRGGRGRWKGKEKEQREVEEEEEEEENIFFALTLLSVKVI